MAKYCRYCGEKMKRPQDRFCYKCRREGSAVDRFYRKIKEEDKLPMNEKEQDILRTDGLGTFFGICILEFGPLIFLGFDIYSLLSGDGGLISSYIRVFLIFIIVLLAYIGIIAFQLFMLKKRLSDTNGKFGHTKPLSHGYTSETAAAMLFIWQGLCRKKLRWWIILYI